jgi:hypothetical protein
MLIQTVILFMFLVGLGMIFICTRNIFRGDVKSHGKIFPSKIIEKLPFLPLLAGYLIAVSLIVSSATLFMGYHWSVGLSLLSLVGLIYSSLKSISTSVEENEDISHRLPLLIGFIGGSISITVLILSFR